jgi:alpha-D-ribose 1-methylphosphonate 5-triphosphate diphosphatase
MERTIISNARIVTPSDTFNGSCVLENGLICDITHKNYTSCHFDLQEGWLLPGCIDIHTDQLELEINPRPGTAFSLASALYSLDTRAICKGVTTLLSCLRFTQDQSKYNWMHDNVVEKSLELERLCMNTQARHYIQARWDTNFINTDSLLNHVKSLTLLKLLVYNENIPGNRQFRNMDALIKKFALQHDLALEEAREAIENKIERNSKINNRHEVYNSINGTIVIGSHDDTTPEHIEEAHTYGSTLAEMPTTIEAARAAKEHNMWVCMSAANYMRGGSTYGNLATHDALCEHCVDILCSDFHFPAMLASFVKMVRNHISPSRAAGLISLNAARCLGLDDSIGSIENGKAADLVTFQMKEDFAKVKNTWVKGVHVCSFAG